MDIGRLYASWRPSGSHIDVQQNENLLSALQAQDKRGHLTLRFPSLLESLFREYLAESGRETRIALFLIFLFMALTLPWFSVHVLEAPSAVVRFFHPMIYALAPVMVVGGLLSWFRSRSRYTDWWCILTYVVCVSAILMGRSIGAQCDFNVPLLWIGLATTALLVAARMRFWHTLPWVVLASVAAVINEREFVAITPGDYYAVITLILLILITCVGGYSLEYFMRKTWVNSRLLNYISHHDGLTGLLNRQALDWAMQHMVSHVHRERCSFAVAMIDIDFFKNYNDTYGHRAGDRVLRQVANLLKETARRPHDFCSRYGGEEFVLVWADGGYGDLYRLAEAARARIEQANIKHEQSSISDRLTVSIGFHWVSAEKVAALADIMKKTPREGVAQLFDAADQLLYKAKVGGRNQVISSMRE